MPSPGSMAGVVRAPSTRLARWSGSFERHMGTLARWSGGFGFLAAGTGHGGQVTSGMVWSGDGGAGSSTGWGGGEVAVGAAGQLPALLMDPPGRGPAHQG